MAFLYRCGCMEYRGEDGWQGVGHLLLWVHMPGFGPLPSRAVSVNKPSEHKASHLVLEPYLNLAGGEA